MIRSFLDVQTEMILSGRQSRSLPPDIQQAARRKLRLLNNTKAVGDLRVPPGNRLERLKGDREERYSIRVNDQWRITFAWVDGDADDVQIEDYHRG